MIWLAIIFALTLSIAHYFSDRLCSSFNSYGAEKIVSFSAGVAVTYLLLDLIPSYSEHALLTNRILFLYLLGGFVIMHIAEKLTYQHEKSRRRLKKEITLEESWAFFIYHLLIGITLLSFIELGYLKAVLFFIPILLYTAVNSLIISPMKSRKYRLVLSVGSLIGVGLSGYLRSNLHPLVEPAVLGLIIGALLYIIMRHSIPTGRKGKPLYFLLGVIAYTALILLSWFI